MKSSHSKVIGRCPSLTTFPLPKIPPSYRQELSIARAVYRHPEILIFDDSFSALDFKTDREVRDALAKEAKGSTKLIVAQRIGTIMNADRIIVLDDGKVVGQGTHQELLDACDVYRQIAESQLSQSELTA